jgi:hypothetical protein
LIMDDYVELQVVTTKIMLRNFYFVACNSVLILQYLTGNFLF